MMAKDEWAVRLRTDLWRADASGADGVNGLPGGALCAEMRAALAQACPQMAFAAPLAEDYGWGLSAQGAAGPIWIAVSFVGDEADAAAGPHEYVVSIAPAKAGWLPWRKPDPAAAADRARLAAALEAWLTARGVAHAPEG